MWEALTVQNLEHAAVNQYNLQARFFFIYIYQTGQGMKAHDAKIKNLARLLGDNKTRVLTTFLY